MNTYICYAPNSTFDHATRSSDRVYAFGVWVQSTAKGYEGTWTFCGFATTAARAAAVARKEGGIVVPATIVTK